MSSLGAGERLDVLPTMRERQPIEGCTRLRILGECGAEIGRDLKGARPVVPLYLDDHVVTDVDAGAVTGGLVHAEADPSAAHRHRRTLEGDIAERAAHPESAAAAERGQHVIGQHDERAAAASGFEYRGKPLRGHRSSVGLATYPT